MGNVEITDSSTRIQNWEFPFNFTRALVTHRYCHVIATEQSLSRTMVQLNSILVKPLSA
jgi:hypothetical protein